MDKEEETVNFELPVLTALLLNDGEIADLRDADTYYYWDGGWVLADKIQEEIENSLWEELNPDNPEEE